jgi:hypothetical protein
VHRFTENVVKAAKAADPTDSLEQLHERAVTALVFYFLFGTNWVPDLRVTPKAVERRWFDTSRKTLLGIVQRAWNANNKREHILQLSELIRQLRQMMQVNDGLEFLPFVVTVGNELRVWDNWPELHDVQKVFPPPVVAPVMPSASSYANQMQELLAFNQGIYDVRNASTRAQMDFIAAGDRARNRRQEEWEREQRRNRR